MNTYLISYDVAEDANANTVRLALQERIKSYGTWAHITQSFWAIRSDKPATVVRDELMSVLRAHDRIFVVQSAHIAAWNNVFCNNEWLKENV